MTGNLRGQSLSPCLCTKSAHGEDTSPPAESKSRPRLTKLAVIARISLYSAYEASAAPLKAVSVCTKWGRCASGISRCAVAQFPDWRSGSRRRDLVARANSSKS